MFQVLDHSAAVALESYDQSQTTVVAKVKKFLATVNCTPDILPTDVTAKNTKLKAKREARAAAQACMSEADAAVYIKASKKRYGSKGRYGKVRCRQSLESNRYRLQWKLQAADFDTFVKAATERPDSRTGAPFAKPNVVPKNELFRTAFYRLLDGTDLTADTRSELAAVEEALFVSEVTCSL